MRAAVPSAAVRYPAPPGALGPFPALPPDESLVAPDQAGESPPPQCTRCGAVGTHYLTCPGLRLPAGYRLCEDPGRADEDAGYQARRAGPGFAPPRRRRGSGPDHPDWPLPPQRRDSLRG